MSRATTTVPRCGRRPAGPTEEGQMEFSGYDDGVPCWVDVSCNDVGTSAAFYGALFGWEAPEGPPEFGGYRNATLDGKTVAGLGPRMDPNVPTVWSCYVKTSDAAATAAR